MIKSRAVRITLYAVCIFGAGALTGALIAPMIGRSFMRPPDPQQMSRQMLAHLRSGLDLTDEQTAKIKPLIEHTCFDMGTIHRETTQRVLNRIAETNAKVSAFLTPAQKAKFKKMEEEHRIRIHHIHHFAPPQGSSPFP